MVGIITFHFQYNYGSALQALAMQESIRGFHKSCMLLDYYYEKDMKSYDIRWHSKRPDVIAFDLLTLRKSNKRKKAYHDFHKKFFLLSERTSNWKELQRISNTCDILLCGSDQIWNIGLTQGIHPAYFLQFADTTYQKLIAYAPSVSLEKIPEIYEVPLRETLRRFSYISVREEQTAEQLQQITGRQIPCVLDPTLLKDTSFYDALLEDYQIDLPDEYIFIYCLHHMDIRPLQSFAEEYADKENVDIVYFNKYNIYRKYYKYNIFEHDPRAFIYAIKHAKYIVSDSFHAGVFSILYKKEFVTYALSDSKSRMDTLFHHLDIHDRFINESTKVPQPIQYDTVYDRLRELRKDSLRYLEHALGIE